MGRGEGYTGFCWGNLRERGNLRKPVIERGVNIKMDLQEIGNGFMDCIELAQNRDRRLGNCQLVVNRRGT